MVRSLFLDFAEYSGQSLNLSVCMTGSLCVKFEPWILHTERSSDGPAYSAKSRKSERTIAKQTFSGGQPSKASLDSFNLYVQLAVQLSSFFPSSPPSYSNSYSSSHPPLILSQGVFFPHDRKLKNCQFSPHKTEQAIISHPEMLLTSTSQLAVRLLWDVLDPLQAVSLLSTTYHSRPHLFLIPCPLEFLQAVTHSSSIKPHQCSLQY